MVHVPDLILPPVDGPIRLAGAMFRILHTPGHSSGHICAVTPDNVCYTGDALMSQALLDAKLPYGLSIQLAMESRERLRELEDCDFFIMAHKGVCAGRDRPPHRRQPGAGAPPGRRDPGPDHRAHGLQPDLPGGMHPVFPAHPAPAGRCTTSGTSACSWSI